MYPFSRRTVSLAGRVLGAVGVASRSCAKPEVVFVSSPGPSWFAFAAADDADENAVAKHEGTGDTTAITSGFA